MKGDDMAMVSFDELFTDANIAGLVTFVRSRFGGQPAPVTAANVEEIRRSLDADGFTPEFHQIGRGARKRGSRAIAKASNL